MTRLEARLDVAVIVEPVDKISDAVVVRTLVDDEKVDAQRSFPLVAD